MKNKKVLFILYSLSVGGAEKRAVIIANYLISNGFELEILLLDNNEIKFDVDKRIKVVYLKNEKAKNQNVFQKASNKLHKKLLSPHYEEYELITYLNQRYTEKIRNYIKIKKDYTVVSWMTFANISTCNALRFLRNELILVECTSPDLEFSKKHPASVLKRKLYPRAQKIICQTNDAAQYYYFLPKTKKTVIPNPIIGNYPERFTGKRKKIIVTFSRLTKEKNISLLIDAFYCLHNDYPEYQLHIYGEGFEKESLVLHSQKLGLDNSVLFFEFNTELHETIKEYSMFVSASNREGMSNSMLESMAIGLPTVVTDCGGAPRMLIENYNNGIVIPTNDKNALYNAMKYIIEHPKESERMSIRSTEIKKMLSIDNIGNKWIIAIMEE